MIVTLKRRGITSKGIRSISGIYWRNWNKLMSVHVINNIMNWQIMKILVPYYRTKYRMKFYEYINT